MHQDDIAIQFQGYEDMQINICRFIEVDDNENEMQEEEQKKEEEKKEEDEANVIEKEANEGGESAMDMDSNPSESHSQMSNITIEQEERKLKDFKNLIAEKSVPQSIKILSNTIIFLLFLLLALTGNISFSILKN